MIVNIPAPENVPIELLTEDGQNPNRMSKTQLTALMENLKRYGFIIPIITNKDYLVADGAQRLSAAKALGMTHVPVVRLDVSDVDRRILRQVLNKLRGDHNEALDDEEFKRLMGAGAMKDLELLLGESDRKLVQFLATIEKEGLNEDDTDVEKAVANPKYDVKLGDVWELGDHRLMCGDSTISENVQILMGGLLADMVFTDPPYGVDYASKNRFLNRVALGERIEEPILGDELEDYEEFFSTIFEAMKGSLAEKNSIYLTISGQKSSEMITAMKKAGYKFSQLLVWVKNNHVLGRQDYANKHELIVYGWYGTHLFHGGFDTTVWEINRPNNSDLHPTMKPIELMTRALGNSSLPGQVTLDLFGGSGSTLIACEMLGRKCRMMELSPAYCSVIIERWENLTGKKANKIINEIKEVA